jgi:hypothetical protein
MSDVAFDSHAFVKRLTSVGMPEAQAEILADEQARLIDGRLATKADIAALGADIARLKAATKMDIARLENGAKRDIGEAELRLEAKIAASKSETLYRN